MLPGLKWNQITGSPSSSCEIIILQNKNHGENIRVCTGIFTTALRKEKKYRQILNRNTSPYFHSASLDVWPLSWNEAILASYPFLDLLFLLLGANFHNDRSLREIKLFFVDLLWLICCLFKFAKRWLKGIGHSLFYLVPTASTAKRL